MTKRQLLWILVYSFLMVFATIAASCEGSESGRRASQSTAIVTRQLFQLNVTIVQQVDSVRMDTINEQYYCYARDKYDADRLFNDSVSVLKLSTVEAYSINQIKAYHWQR